MTPCPWLDRDRGPSDDPLRLQVAASDLVLAPEGEDVFLELNPTGQWGWLEEAQLPLPVPPPGPAQGQEGTR